MSIFSLFVHSTTSPVPKLIMEGATDEPSLRKLAGFALLDSPHNLLVEVRENDQLLFTLDREGVSWRRPVGHDATI